MLFSHSMGDARSEYRQQGSGFDGSHLGDSWNKELQFNLTGAFLREGAICLLPNLRDVELLGPTDSHVFCPWETLNPHKPQAINPYKP